MVDRETDSASTPEHEGLPARLRLMTVLTILSMLCLGDFARVAGPASSGLIHINTSFENASPLYWETDADNLIHVYLIYDQERSSPNRANGHWFFEVQADPNTRATIVLHNDEYGKLHIARPPGDIDVYLKSMETLEAVLRKYTWFTEGSTGANVRNPGGIGEGLLTQFGINSCLLELNANWIAGLNAPASAQGWKLFGAQLCEALYHYFDASS